MTFQERLGNQKIIPVVKLDRLDDTLPLLDALWAGGCSVAEITFRTDVGVQALALAASARPAMLIGAGTVINAEQAALAVTSGAEFVVSPGFDAETAEYLSSVGVPYVAGAATPTEIMSIIAAGGDVVKFFPAGVFGGNQAIKALSAPFPHISFIPTGGVNSSNLADYIRNPRVLAVGGSWMVDSGLIKGRRFDEITRLTAEAEWIAKSATTI